MVAMTNVLDAWLGMNSSRKPEFYFAPRKRLRKTQSMQKPAPARPQRAGPHPPQLPPQLCQGEQRELPLASGSTQKGGDKGPEARGWALERETVLQKI